MSNRAVQWAKPFVFLLFLAPSLLEVRGLFTNNLGTDPVTTLTHNTGDLAVYCLLIGLAISPVRKLSPKLAFLVRFRRMIGLFAFYYASLHLLIYVFLFSGFDVTSALANLKAHQWMALKQNWLDVWPTLRDDLKKRVFIQVGLLAWLLLLALAVTSPQQVLRRMGGKPWQTLHRLVYGAAVLSMVHYWWLVKKGNLAPLRDTLVLLVLLLARPAWNWWQKRRVRPTLQPVASSS